MKEILVLLALGLNGYVIAQPGIYTEADIEIQTMYIDAELDKYKGDTDSQIATLGQILKRNKASHAAHHELAKTYSTLADYEMAEKHARKAATLQPKNEWYLLTLATIQEKSNQIAEAIESYNQLKTVNSDNPTTYHRMAMLQLSAGQAKAAAATLEQLQSKQGVDEETSRRIFDIYRKAGDKKQALATLIKLTDTNKDNPRLLNNLASYYMETGDQKAATKVYQKILTIDPNDAQATMALATAGTKDKSTGGGLSQLLPIMSNKNVPLDDKIKELMPYVVSMTKTGAKTDDLNTISQQLIELYPNEAKAHSLRADVQFYQGLFTESAKSYKKAIQLDDRKYTLWSQYLLNLWELSDYKTMSKVSESAIDLYPNKVTAFLLHALSISKADPKTAAQYINEAGFIAGSNPQLKSLVQLVDYWTVGKATAAELQALNLSDLAEPLYLELAGDLYANIDKKMADKLWNQAINMGSNPERINKKLGLE